ncbi:hypothetical protein A4R44_07629 [Amycolatopsis sp. M39]|uniref:Uncharacterized protein n=1 Tax=Amycolatopsis rubida TaxID=112413 RepID=A0A1I5NEQ8_9PSEU|nr:hypothetical protein A4R44_07629 [Amycolatopsis sp. M39]SFP20172.1 hypothetical protein SAMN05421854_104362 [Amycolatopsis rubida]
MWMALAGSRFMDSTTVIEEARLGKRRFVPFGG